jgi:hypothetical protein
MAMTRRNFIKAGIGGLAALTVAPLTARRLASSHLQQHETRLHLSGRGVAQHRLDRV